MAANEPLLPPHTKSQTANGNGDASSPEEQNKFGFAIGDPVSFDGVGRVVGFTDNFVKVELEGARSNIPIQPYQLHKVEVQPWMLALLRAFCGHLDIWFLKQTFMSPWSEGSHEVEDLIKKEAETIFKGLQMEEWSMESVPPVVAGTLGVYLRYVLSPSVFLYRAHAAEVHVVLGGILVVMLLYTIWGCANLRSDYTDEEALASGALAFRAVEHAPVTPLVLLFCTHLIMMIFAAKQVQELSNEAKHLPFPLTYPMIVGKVFMVLRMVLAYSSGNLGESVDYFLWQELLLIVTHGVLSAAVGDPSPERGGGPFYAKQLAHVFVVIFGIDVFKTLVMVIFWCNYEAGRVASGFNRLPSISVQLTASVLIHAVLDLVQTFMSMFTMFIGRAFATLITDESQGIQLEEAEPADDVSPAVKKLLGRWKSKRNGSINTFSLMHWKLQVPDGAGATINVTTKYQVRVPQAVMEVRIPDNLKPGDTLRVTEVRLMHHVFGCLSYDASTLVSEDGTYKLLKSAQGRLSEADNRLDIEGVKRKWTWVRQGARPTADLKV